MTKHKQGSSRAAAPSWAVAYQIHLDMADCGHPGFLRDKHGLPMLHTPDDFRGLGFKLDSTGNVEPLHRPLPDARTGAEETQHRWTTARLRSLPGVARDAAP